MVKRTLLFLVILSTILYAQETPNSGMGVSVSYQSSQFDIVIPFWLGETVILAPSIGFVHIEDSGQDYRIGLLLKKYLSKEKASPFLGFHGGVAIYSPESDDPVTDLVFGIAAGAEYFVDKHFSLGIEGQLNGTKSDDNSARFGAEGKLIINTAAAIYATIYFN